MTKTEKEEVSSIFNLASGSEMSKIMKKVLNGMSDPKLHGNMKNPWNKFQKLFSEHGGYKVLDSLKDGIGKFTKNPDQFISVDELYDLAKFSEKASSGVGAGLVFISSFTGNVIVDKILDKAVTKLYNIIDNG